MHELGVARSLVEMVRDRLIPGERVREVEVEVGALTGLVPESLEFYFQGLTAETPLAGVRLICRRVPACFRCPDCGLCYLPETFAPVCIECGALGGTLLSGRELNLLRIGERVHV